MAKVKNLAMNDAENQVDKFISKLKDGQIDLDTCKSKILQIANIELIDIDEYNIDEVLAMECQ